MENKEINLIQFLEATPERQNEAWYDWFCKEASLPNKTKKLVSKLKQIVGSPKLNPEKQYVFFKNNCPVAGSLYDDFRICDIETGDVLYTTTPSRTNHVGQTFAEVWGKENDFQEPLVCGTWKDVLFFFGVGEDPEILKTKAEAARVRKENKIHYQTLVNEANRLREEANRLLLKASNLEEEAKTYKN